MSISPRRLALNEQAKLLGIKGFSRMTIPALEAAIEVAEECTPLGFAGEEPMNRTNALEELNDDEEFIASRSFAPDDIEESFVESFNNEFAERVISATEKAVESLSGFAPNAPTNRAARRQARKDARLRGDGRKRGTRKSF